MSISICPLFVRSNFCFDYFTSKLEIWGKIALVAWFLSIGWNRCISWPVYSVLLAFQTRALGGRPIRALSTCWCPPAIHFACSRHVSSQWIMWLIQGPLLGMSLSILPLFVLSNLHLDSLTSKFEFGGQVTLIAQSPSIGCDRWFYWLFYSFLSPSPCRCSSGRPIRVPHGARWCPQPSRWVWLAFDVL